MELSHIPTTQHHFLNKRTVVITLATTALMTFSVTSYTKESVVTPQKKLFSIATTETKESSATIYKEKTEELSKTPPGQIPIRDNLLKMLDPSSPGAIFKVVDTIEADDTLSLNCHELAHDIGHKAFEVYGFSGAMNFTDTTRLNHASIQDICAGGYVHGVLEEASLYQVDFKEHPGAMCDTVPPRRTCWLLPWRWTCSYVRKRS